MEEGLLARSCDLEQGRDPPQGGARRTKSHIPPSLSPPPSRTVSLMVKSWKSETKKPVDAVLPGQTPEQQAAEGRVQSGLMGELVPSS